MCTLIKLKYNSKNKKYFILDNSINKEFHPKITPTIPEHIIKVEKEDNRFMVSL